VVVSKKKVEFCTSRNLWKISLLTTKHLNNERDGPMMRTAGSLSRSKADKQDPSRFAMSLMLEVSESANS
jgi:hypothetical protein